MRILIFRNRALILRLRNQEHVQGNHNIFILFINKWILTYNQIYDQSIIFSRKRKAVKLAEAVSHEKIVPNTKRTCTKKPKRTSQIEYKKQDTHLATEESIYDENSNIQQKIEPKAQQPRRSLRWSANFSIIYKYSFLINKFSLQTPRSCAIYWIRLLRIN